MHYGEADLNNPIIRNQFMNDFNTYRNKKQKNTLTPDYINKSLQNQSIQSLKNSLSHLHLSSKGKKSILINRLEKDIRILIKVYDL